MKHLVIVLALLSLTLTCKHSAKVGNSALTDELSASGYHVYKVGNREKGWNLDTERKDYYHDEIQPIFTARCVACHGCYEAPCQTNLQSYDLVRRGYNATPQFASKKPYAMKRTKHVDMGSAMDPTVLQRWRDLEFIPVVAHKDEKRQEDRLPGPGDDDKVRAALDGNAEKSVMYSLLEQGRQNNPGFDANSVKPLQDFEDDTQYYRCIATDKQFREHFTQGIVSDRGDNPWEVIPYGKYRGEFPFGGMPFGMTKLEDSQHETLTKWMSTGAVPPQTDLPMLVQPSNPEVIARWEEFLNPARNDPDSLKKQLVARYIYEHLFSAHLAFDSMPGEFYDLVRSTTRNGKIEEILTDNPYNLPEGVERVFYRLRKITRAIVQKKHIIWPANDNRLNHLKELFWGDYRVTELPPYNETNPFKVYREIPTIARARFMMENSHVLAGAMTQGSVCVGSRATYAIRDHFWVWFLRPEVDPSVQNPNLGLGIDDLDTAPIEWQPSGVRDRALQAALVAADAASFVIPDNLMERMLARLIEIFQIDRTTVGEKLKNVAWKLSEFNIKPSMVFQVMHHYAASAKRNQRYAAAWEENLRKVLQASKDRGERPEAGLRIEDLWDGQGDSGYPEGNPNAWVNIMRHQKSSTIHYGSEGGKPQSIWVLSYSNFERLYYNLVVNYREFDSLPFKLATWRHMSYVRLEAEDLAISFLPPSVREEVRKSFTQGLGEIKQDMFFDHHSMTGTPRPVATDIGGEGVDGTVKAFVEKAKEVLGPIEAAHTGAIGEFENLDSPAFIKLAELTEKSQEKDQAPWPQFMPETIYVNVTDSRQKHFTLTNDRGYQAHNIVFIESRNRDPKGDSLSLFRGFVGAYPDVFLKLTMAELDQFVAEVKAVSSAEAWANLARRYGVRRNSAEFWPHFDAIHTWKSEVHPGNDPKEQAIADLRLYDFF